MAQRTSKNLFKQPAQKIEHLLSMNFDVLAQKEKQLNPFQHLYVAQQSKSVIMKLIYWKKMKENLSAKNTCA